MSGEDLQIQNIIRIQPQSVIIFYRNQFQSASSIKIIKKAICNKTIHFQLKTTNKHAYLVSDSYGEIQPQKNHYYINILINQNVPLENCLSDRFKLNIIIQNKPMYQRKFKVMIDYKKQTSKINTKDQNRFEIASKSSNSQMVNPSIIGPSITSVKKSMVKKSQLLNYLGNTKYPQRVCLKEQIDEIQKQIEQKKQRLQILQQQIRANKSKKRLLTYLTLMAIVLSFFFGVIMKALVLTGINYTQSYHDTQSESWWFGL